MVRDARWSTSDLFASDAARQEFERDLNLLWVRLVVDANANYEVGMAVRDAPIEFLLGKLSEPFHLLQRMGENAIRLAALDTINVLTDKAKDALTLEFLRRRLLHLCDPAKRAALGTYLKEEFAARDLPDLRRRAQRLRGNILAHANAEHLRDPGRFPDTRLKRSDLDALLEGAKELVLVLSFEVGRSFDFMDPGARYRMAELVRDIIRLHSHILRMPEEQPDLFEVMWKNWSEQERDTFKDWRERVGSCPGDPES